MMKKIVLLGCENSHSTQFAGYITSDKKYKDVEILGVHSELDKPQEEKLANQFNLKRLSSYDEAVGKVDGVIVTARHGGYHLKFYKPYIRKGLTAFIDKPVTISEKDAIELAKISKENDVKLTGQSSLILDSNVKELAKIVKEKEVLGGYVRAPIDMDNPHGGFYFYSEHLVDIVLTIFGSYPKSVIATEHKNNISILFKYDNFDVYGSFGKSIYVYSAGVFTNEGTATRDITVSGGEKCFKDHFDEFYETMKSKKNTTDYKQFIAPVFVLNAIEKSYKTKKEVKVRRFDI